MTAIQQESRTQSNLNSCVSVDKVSAHHLPQDQIEVRRKFNIISFDKPNDPRIVAEIHKKIAVRRKVVSRERGKLYTEFIYEPCFRELGTTNTKRYLMGFGFYADVEKIFAEYNKQTLLLDTSPPNAGDLRRLVPNRAAIDRINWRDDQRDIVEDILRTRVGQYVVSTGAGKSFLIRKLCEVFDRARICITTSGTQLLTDFYTELMAGGKIDVGIYHSTNRKPSGRVLLCSLGMLHRFKDREFDILLLDEKHECATINRINSLLATNCRSAYGFSANHDDRADLADNWLRAMFGDLRSYITHKDSVDAGDIVPVNVNWVPVKINDFPELDAADSSRFERLAFWNNDKRNEIIARLALAESQQSQTLVYVKTVQHAYQLRKLLNCPVAHAVLTPFRWRQLKAEKLVAADEEPPTLNELEKLRRDMSSGKVRLAISNSVWKRGVDFPQLQVLIRADGSSTMQDATQITGRVTRKYVGKTQGVVIDFVDYFHRAALRKSYNRRNNYRKLGYKQSLLPK